jgi:hypothetical protein
LAEMAGIDVDKIISTHLQRAASPQPPGLATRIYKDDPGTLLSPFSLVSTEFKISEQLSIAQIRCNNYQSPATPHHQHNHSQLCCAAQTTSFVQFLNMSAPTATVPATCCHRDGSAECVCAKQATCSCGKKPALQCDCDKAATENNTTVSSREWKKERREM